MTPLLKSCTLSKGCGFTPYESHAESSVRLGSSSVFHHIDTVCLPIKPHIMATRKIEPATTSLPPPTQAPILPSPTLQSIAPASTTNKPIEASWKNFYTPDFTAVHQPLDSENNEFLIFGNLDVSPPTENTSKALAAFLGRWEGVEIGPYGDTGTQLVLLVSQITPQDGIAYLWAGTDLQYPFFIKEIQFQSDSRRLPYHRMAGRPDRSS